MTDAQTSEQLVKQQLTQLQALKGLLEEEKKVLQNHNPDDLTELTDKKNNLLIEIKDLDIIIGRSVEFAQDKAAGKYLTELDEIKDLLTRCQAINLVNGQIIQQSQLAVQRMKTSLLESHNKSAITYDDKGKKHAGLSSLNIKA
jgi:flagella synthesis protein FlgN